MTQRFAILISGRGSNMEAVLRYWSEGLDPLTRHSEPVLVVSNRAKAPGLERARRAGITTEVLPHRGFRERAKFDLALATLLESYQVDLVVLAGFMRVLGSDFVRRFPKRVLNIHPSLLPAFPGLDAPGQAIAAGVKVSGCTVHFVDEGVDTGPIIAQAPVEVIGDDTSDTLGERIRVVEHTLYPRVIAQVAAAKMKVARENPQAHEVP